MNANEMADGLAKVPIEIFGKVRMMDVRIMLRQLQAENEALKAKLQLHETMDNQCASLMRQIKEG